jgi:hypothetical protein
MSSVIQLAIEGEGAIEASQALCELSGLEGSFEVNAEIEREGVLATVATIVGIVGGTLTAAEQIRDWYAKHRNQSLKKTPEKTEKIPEKTIAKVLIVGKNGDRILLENATIEQIEKILS